MVTIKVFLASSIKEFSKERQTLMAFFQTLNNIYHERGVFLEMIICESLSHQMLSVRSQELYNQAIQESEYFYVIIGKQAGEYTIEEFNVAYHSYQANGLPRIYTYFQTLDESASQSVIGFKNYLSQNLQHYYNTYTHVDTIKLNLLVELNRDPRVKSVMSFEDGQAVINGQALLSMENIPLYSRNETVRKLVKEKEELEQEFADLAGLGNSAAVERLRQKNIERRSSVASQLHELEMDILDLCKQTENNRSLGKKLNWREMKAMELVDEGSYEAAKEILRDDQWKREVRHAGQIIAGAQQIIAEYISGKRTLIRTIKATGINQETEKEILEIYEDICDLAAKNQMELDVLFEYVKFLWRQNHYLKAVSTCEKLILLLKLSEGQEEQLARTKLLLGAIYSRENEFDKAEISLQDALTDLRKLSANREDAYQDEFAAIYNYLAIIYDRRNQPDEAEAMNREALRIRRDLAAENPFEYNAALATSCNNLALNLIFKKEFDEAEVLLKEALEIRKNLHETDPADFRCAVAKTCKNIGNLMKNKNMFEEAEKYYREALDLFTELKNANPRAYELDYAEANMRLSKLYRRLGRYDEAEALCFASEKAYSRWVEQDFDLYGRYLAQLYHQWADLYIFTKQYDSAKELCEKALAIFERLEQKTPGAYKSRISWIRKDIAKIERRKNETI